MPTKLTAALLVLLCGCSTTATISRINGRTVEAKISRSDGKSLYVKTAEGPEAAIPRADVTEIDHPGNGTAVFGALLTTYGALNIAMGMKTCSESGSGAYCIGTFLPAAVGLPMLLWGLKTWGDSLGAAASTSTSGYTGVVPSPSPTSPFDFSPPGDSGRLSALGTR